MFSRKKKGINFQFYILKSLNNILICKHIKILLIFIMFINQFILQTIVNKKIYMYLNIAVIVH